VDTLSGAADRLQQQLCHASLLVLIRWGEEERARMGAGNAGRKWEGVGMGVQGGQLPELDQAVTCPGYMHMYMEP
jgi:hypothetical protein